MILYFSGTGNTKYIAKTLSSKLNDECFDLKNILCEQPSSSFYSSKPFVILSPIYAWGLPKDIINLIKKSIFLGSSNVYVIVTMGENYGRADKKIKKIILNKKMSYKGFYAITMPNNYFVGFKLNDYQTQLKIIRNSIKEIDYVFQKIKNNDCLICKDKIKTGGFMLRLMSSLINFFFNLGVNKINKFTVSNNCVKCLKCVNFCPMHNIAMEDDKIIFNKKCMSCLGCVSICPTNSIDINHKAKRNGVYHFPNNIKEYE